MSTTNMPGFTAETSLYRSKTNYSMVGAHGALPSGGAVVPQTWVSSKCSNPILGTNSWCDFNCNPDYPHLCGCSDIQYDVPCGLLVDLLVSIF
jgi:hypothetical protein